VQSAYVADASRGASAALSKNPGRLSALWKPRADAARYAQKETRDRATVALRVM
jgi:hypothetical protein